MIRPQFLSGRGTSPEPSGKARDPYDRSKELKADAGEEECGLATRT